jgi:hypothetical protein
MPHVKFHTCFGAKLQSSHSITTKVINTTGFLGVCRVLLYFTK